MTLLARSILLALLCAAPLTAQDKQPERAAPARRADHVVLISIDGLRPEFYLNKRYPTPVLRTLAEQGAHAKAVRGVFPSVTYPSHTTMITGALPARHGVLYNRPFEPKGPTGRWYWESKAIKVPTLWDAARQAKLTSAALSWPVTVGAPIDRTLPEIWSLDRKAKPLEALKGATTQGLWEELEREATGRLRPSAFNMDELHLDATIGRMGAYLLEHKRPNLLAIHFVGADHFQHEQGRAGPMVDRALSVIDAAIGLLIDAARRAKLLERTAFVVTGDHGFVDVHSRLAPNVWLVDAKLRDASRAFGPSWRATFHTTGGAALLRLQDPKDTEAVAQVRAALAALPRGIQKTFRIVERKALDAIGADPAAPLALAAVQGYSFSSSATGPALRKGGGGTHGYFPDFPEIHTGLIAWGAGVEDGARARQLSLTDVAPLVSELLDLKLKAPDGSLPRGFLE